jgi:hypothetical protein
MGLVLIEPQHTEHKPPGNLEIWDAQKKKKNLKKKNQDSLLSPTPAQRQ